MPVAEGGSPGQLGLRAGTFQIFLKRTVGKGDPRSLVETKQHAAVGQSARQWPRGSEEGARRPQPGDVRGRSPSPELLGAFLGREWKGGGGGADLEGASEQTRQPRGTGQDGKRVGSSHAHACTGVLPEVNRMGSSASGVDGPELAPLTRAQSPASLFCYRILRIPQSALRQVQR